MLCGVHSFWPSFIRQTMVKCFPLCLWATLTPSPLLVSPSAMFEKSNSFAGEHGGRMVVLDAMLQEVMVLALAEAPLKVQCS